MLIQDFYSKLTTRKEQGILFEALRRLRLLEDPQCMVVANSDGDSDGGGDSSVARWTVWGEAGSGSLDCCAAARAV